MIESRHARLIPIQLLLRVCHYKLPGRAHPVGFISRGIVGFRVLGLGFCPGLLQVPWQDVTLEAGEMLYIPRKWFHFMEAR